MVKTKNNSDRSVAFPSRIQKRGQEEMVGFALIVIIVAVIIIIFLGLSLSKKNVPATESYEAENFVQATLQYTTQCRDSFGYVQIDSLIFDCLNGVSCAGESDSCEVLNSTLSGLLKEGWSAGSGGLTKGYIFNINSSRGNLLEIKEGEITSGSKGSYQPLSRGGNSVGIRFTVYN